MAIVGYNEPKPFVDYRRRKCTQLQIYAKEECKLGFLTIVWQSDYNENVAFRLGRERWIDRYRDRDIGRSKDTVRDRSIDR